MRTDDNLRCPSCSGADIRHSLPRGFLDSFMTMFGKAPFRCRRCDRRFYGQTTILSRPKADKEADRRMSVRRENDGLRIFFLLGLILKVCDTLRQEAPCQTH